LRESEYNRGTGCGKTARPGLCGGRWVTGVPTVRKIAIKNNYSHTLKLLINLYDTLKRSILFLPAHTLLFNLASKLS